MADNELSNKYGKIYDDMLKGLKEYIEKKIDESRFDKTYLGTIMGEGSVKGLKVLINDVIYDNVDSATFLYNPNSIVRVLVPQNDFKRAYVLGTTKINADEVNNFQNDYYHGYKIEIDGNVQEVYSAVDASILINNMSTTINNMSNAINAIFNAYGTYIRAGSFGYTVSANQATRIRIDIKGWGLPSKPNVFVQIEADSNTFNAGLFALSVRDTSVNQTSGIVEYIDVICRSTYSNDYYITFWLMAYKE